MSYVKQNFVDGQTLTAAQLNHMEAGIANAAGTQGEKGDKGEKGDPGPAGAKGDPGEGFTANAKALLLNLFENAAYKTNTMQPTLNALRAEWGGSAQEVPVQSVSLSAVTMTLNESESQTLTATVLPANATDRAVVWSVLPTGFATGNSKIYVQHKGYEYTATVDASGATATFINPHGFSTFTVTPTASAVAEVDGTNYTGYTGNATHFECDTSAFAEDDIVLFTYSQAEKSIQTVVKAESTEGIVSEYTLTKSLTLADKEYKYAKNIVFDFGAENMMRTKNTYTIYTDANGLVIFVTESEFKPTDYAFVLDAEASSQTGFKFDRAKLVLADGSVKTVYTDDNYADCKGYIVTYRANGDNEYVLRKAPNTTFNGGTISDSMFSGDSDIPTQGVLTGGKTPKQTNATISDFFMQNGNAKVYPGNDATLYANSETVFVVAESDRTGTTYTSYTGIKNAPEIVDAGTRS